MRTTTAQQFQNPFSVLDRRPLYGVVMVEADPRARVPLAEFSHYKRDSLQTIAAVQALDQHRREQARGVVDRDGGRTFYYSGLGQLPPGQGNGDNWYPTNGGSTSRPSARNSNPMNRRVTNIRHTNAGATDRFVYLAPVPQVYSPC